MSLSNKNKYSGFEYLWYFNTDFSYQFSVLLSHVPWKIFGTDDPEVWIYLYRYDWGSKISNSFILLYKFIGVQAKRKAASQRFNWILAIKFTLKDLPEKQKKCSCWHAWQLLDFCLFSSATFWSALIYTVCFAYDWVRYLVTSMQWCICS